MATNLRDPVGEGHHGGSARPVEAPAYDGTFDFGRSKTAEWLTRCGESACEGCTPFCRAVRRGSPGSVTCLLLVVFCVLFAGQMLVKDETVDVREALHLIPPGAMCANQEDMYDDETRVCQLRNKYAYAYLLGHSWVMCAPNMDGAQALRVGEDRFGNFWYGTEKREEVRKFYQTCVPTCADDADIYDSTQDACMVSKQLAIVYLAGQGSFCAKGTPGAKAIRTQSKQVGDGNYWYRPEMASRVKPFYATCRSACARGDRTAQQVFPGSKSMSGLTHCQVENPDALAYLQSEQMLRSVGIKPDKTEGKGGITCDDSSPGRSAITADSTGSGRGAKTTFWYRASKGAAVQSWYSSCVVGPVEEIHGGVDGYGGSELVPGDGGGRDMGEGGGRQKMAPAPPTVAPDGKLTFAYPKEASSTTPTVCNFSGKTFWFTFEDTGKEDWAGGKGYKYLPTLKHGQPCVTLKKVTCALLDGGPLSASFRHCGFVIPCDENDFCDETKGKAIQAGINIINGKGAIEWLPVRSSAR